MTSREQLHAKIAKELRTQEYGYINAQPSIKGMAWAIVNTVWSDIAEEQIAEQQREIRDLSEQRRNLRGGAA